MMFGFGRKREKDCPWFKEPCRKHDCEMYEQVIGMNPNTGEQINKHECVFKLLPMLLIENSQQQRQTGASVDKVATEVRNAADQGRIINLTFPAPDLKLINQ